MVLLQLDNKYFVKLIIYGIINYQEGEMRMEKIIPNGTEVLIFFNSKNDYEEERFIKGVIISSKESEDLSYHGSPWYVQIYKIKGENGQIYEATHQSPLFGAFYIRTIEGYLAYLEYKIKENKKKINDIENENMNLSNIITSLSPLPQMHHEQQTISSDSEEIAKMIENFKYVSDKETEVLNKYDNNLTRTRKKNG